MNTIAGGISVKLFNDPATLELSPQEVPVEVENVKKNPIRRNKTQFARNAQQSKLRGSDERNMTEESFANLR